MGAALHAVNIIKFIAWGNPLVWLLKLAFVTNDDLLILDCLFSYLIWSDVMIKQKKRKKKLVWLSPIVESHS